MLSKLYQSISSWLCPTKRDKVPPYTIMEFQQKKVRMKQRFVLKNEKKIKTYVPSQQKKLPKNIPQKLSSPSIQVYPQIHPPPPPPLSTFPKNAQQTQQYYYKIILEQAQKQDQQQKEREQVENFLQKLTISKQSQQQLAELFGKMSLSEPEKKQLKKTKKIIQNQSKEIDEALKNKQFPNGLFQDYMEFIDRNLSYKYSRELKTDFKKISFQEYKKVIDVWKPDRNHDLVPNYQHLKYQDLKNLAYGQWLNDQVITDYLALLHQTYTKNIYIPNNIPLPRVLDSLQTKTIFDKSDYRKISRILCKKNIQLIERDTNGKQIQQKPPTQRIIMVIHYKQNHWLFIVLDVLDLKLTIYDSLKSKIGDYINFKTINNIVGFFNQYYRSLDYPLVDTDYNLYLKIKICQNYPQQTNGHDCGMMVLSGIRDIMRYFRMWTFGQADIKYKRVLVTLELLDKKIYGI